MIEIKINKNVGSYDPKVAGTPFTLRQLVCIALAAGASYGIYALATPLGLPKDVVGFLCIIPAGIAVAFGWLKPSGVPLERYLRTIFVSFFLAPAQRKYITDNTIQFDDHTSEKKKEKKKKYKISPEAVK